MTFFPQIRAEAHRVRWLPGKLAAGGIRVFLLLIFLLTGVASAVNPEPDTRQTDIVYILVSSKIGQYLEAVEGIQDTLKSEDTVTVIVENLKTETTNVSNTLLLERLQSAEPDMVIAVGEKAAFFLFRDSYGLSCHKLYTMVLNPERLSDDPASLCGISLNMSVEQQLRHITALLPAVKTIGIPNNPVQNEEYVRNISQAASQVGISIKSISILSRSDLPSGLAGAWRSVDALWLVPDHTVTSSESLVKYIIKEALSVDVPVFYYNRSFYESGAVLSFVIDYYKMGSQAAELALRVLDGDACVALSPEFETWLNMDAQKALGVEVDIDGAAGLAGVVTGK